MEIDITFAIRNEILQLAIPMSSEKNSNITPSCTVCGFSPFCCVDGKNLLQKSSINPAVKKYRILKKHEVLYSPRTLFHSLYAIKTGHIKTYEVDKGGNELIRGFYLMGEILGLDAIALGKYPFYAKALSETIVCEIPYHQFVDLLSSKLSFQKTMLCLISRELTATSYLSFVKGEQRLAAFLINLHQRQQERGASAELILPMSRQEIGNYLGLTAETISRLLSQFKENKIISTSHKKIRFLQTERLKIIAGVNLS